MTLPTRTRLGPYEIIAPLGTGGMGEVYRARDSKLDRDVAIKVLPESLVEDPDRLARFEREAKAVASLSHPNILSIFDFGTQDGVSYAVMELLEGETLREKLEAGPIPQTQAVGYALQIVKGLSAAHERGIVHRDLKPENLFVLKDGHLKVLDFGLAKRVEAAAPGQETSAPTGSIDTEPGTVLGTVGYMSPEQVRGQPVDHRSDIFSFGTILYELLSGKRAFRRGSAAETMAAILKEEPPELSESGRNVSPTLDHIVRHCLEKEPDSRFQSARDIAFSLSEQSSAQVPSGARFADSPARRPWVYLVLAAAVALAVAGFLMFGRRTHEGSGAARGVKRVAVLPFENLGASEDEYFADGIADAVRGKLTTLPGVQVIARGSSTPYKKTTKTPRQIAQELEVGYLLTATVRWQKGAGGASRVQVSPELVEIPRSGAPTSKWQQPFDAALTDVFQVQSDIAARVARELDLALGDGSGDAPPGEADAEPRCLRRLPQGRGDVRQSGQRFPKPEAGTRLLRTGPGAGPRLRGSLGPGSLRPTRSCTTLAGRPRNWPGAPGRRPRRRRRSRPTAPMSAALSALIRDSFSETMTALWRSMRNAGERRRQMRIC